METLRDKWKGGRPGTLCAMEQAKVWALREVMKDTDEGVNYETIASKVVKIGPKGEPASTTWRGSAWVSSRDSKMSWRGRATD